MLGGISAQQRKGRAPTACDRTAAMHGPAPSKWTSIYDDWRRYWLLRRRLALSIEQRPQVVMRPRESFHAAKPLRAPDDADQRPQPTDECRRPRIEPSFLETTHKIVALEVNGYEDEALRFSKSKCSRPPLPRRSGIELRRARSPSLAHPRQARRTTNEGRTIAPNSPSSAAAAPTIAASDSADEGIRERIIEDMRRCIPQPVQCSLNS